MTHDMVGERRTLILQALQYHKQDILMHLGERRKAARKGQAWLVAVHDKRINALRRKQADVKRLLWTA